MPRFNASTIGSMVKGVYTSTPHHSNTYAIFRLKITLFRRVFYIIFAVSIVCSGAKMALILQLHYVDGICIAITSISGTVSERLILH